MLRELSLFVMSMEKSILENVDHSWEIAFIMDLLTISFVIAHYDKMNQVIRQVNMKQLHRGVDDLDMVEILPLDEESLVM